MTIKYHFFGKDCIIARDLKDRANLNQALEKQGFEAKRILFLNQIHSNLVEVIDDEKKLYGEQNLPKADAIVTNISDVVIGVITADCSPILLFDEEKKIIAAAHAGWRGAKLGVIANTVAAMKKLGAQRITAVIGPMIQQKSYQVSREFFDDFVADEETNSEFFINCSEPYKMRFDLPSYVENKLHQAGVFEIENCKIDTYEDEKNFFSFRRSTHVEEKDCGRNVSVIALI